MIRKETNRWWPPLCKFCGVLFFLFSVSTGQAAFILQIDSSQVEANAKDQVVSIYLIGGPEVQGVNFNLQIETDGTTPAPVITALDLIGSETIFGNNNTGQEILALGPIDDPEVPLGYQFALATTTVSDVENPVFANGLLARVTIDTSGIFFGVFRFNMSDTLNGATDFPFEDEAIGVSRFDGEWVAIGIIPEPSSVVLFGSGVGLLLSQRRRRKTD
jgi:hypothetical protein